MQAWINSLITIGIGAIMAVSGYATLLQPEDKILRLPLTGRISAAFGRSDTLKFVRWNALFLLVVGAVISLFAAIGTINNLGKIPWAV